MLKKFVALFFVLFATSMNASAFDGSQYAQNGEELCNVISDLYGGLNPYSMQCASGAGAGIFTPHESAFCHKLIIERRMDAGRCLRAISAPHIDSKLDTCELKTSEQEILTCLQE